MREGEGGRKVVRKGVGVERWKRVGRKRVGRDERVTDIEWE